MASIEIPQNLAVAVDTYISLARVDADLEAIAHDESWSHGIRVANLARDIEHQFPETARANVASDLGHLRSWAARSQEADAAEAHAGPEMRRYYQSQINTAEDAIDRLRAYVLGYTR